MAYCACAFDRKLPRSSITPWKRPGGIKARHAGIQSENIENRIASYVALSHANVRGPFSASFCVFVTVMIPWTLELAFNCLTCRREVSCECVAMVLVALIEDDLQMSPRVCQLKAIIKKKHNQQQSTFTQLSISPCICESASLCCLPVTITGPQHQSQNYFPIQ